VDHLATHRTLGPLKHPPAFKSMPWCGALLLLAVVAAASAAPRTEPTVDELKARVSSANVGDKAKLCIQIAEKQFAETDKQYAAEDIPKAQATLTDVVTYSELARDYSIQSHKHEKQIEISVRTMARKLNDLVHTLGHDEQTPVKDAIDHLQRVRDDLLASMFPKGAK
jgi:hypothetical protein